MASTGKKGKKSKGKPMPLTQFLATNNEGIQEGYAVVTPKRCVDWAAEVEKEGLDDDNMDPVYSTRAKYILPSAPMGPNVDISKVPISPPFTAFVGNLSYEIEKEDISAFFKELKVSMIRLPRSAGDTGRPRGFGYVEFEDRQSLIEALGMSDSHLKNIRVKIDIAENQDETNRRRDNRGERSDRPERPERIAALSSDWRSSPREEPTKPEGREHGGFRDGGESRSRYSDRYSSDRDNDRYAGQVFDRSSFGTDRERDYGGDRERSGGFGGSSSRNFSDREPRERQYDRGYNHDNRDSYNGYDRGGRSNRREFGTGYRGDDRNSDYGRGNYERGGGSYERGGGSYERGGGSYERNSGGGNYERSSGGGSSYNESNEVEEREPQEKELPRERPKLVLQKRTKPIEEAGQPVAPAAIFGGAKPVDTASRERAIEERLAKEAAAKLDAEAIEKDRDVRHDDYRGNETQEKGRRPSSVSQGRSPRSSTSVAPSSEDGSHHSEADDGGNRPPSSRKVYMAPVPSSAETSWSKRSSSNAQPLPPSSGGPRQRSSEAGDQYTKRNSNYGSADHGGNERPVRSYHSENARDDRGMSRSRGGGRGGTVRGTYRSSGSDRREDRGGEYDYPPQERSRDVDRPPKEMPKFEGPKTPVYTSINKFSDLPVSDDDED